MSAVALLGVPFLRPPVLGEPFPAMSIFLYFRCSSRAARRGRKVFLALAAVSVQRLVGLRHRQFNEPLQLFDAGIATDERPRSDARTRVFRLRPESMTAVHVWLEQIQAHWDAQLVAFKRHVERRNTQ